MSKNTGNLYRNTGLRNGGRKAGYGMYEDDYSEESGDRHYRLRERVRFPNDDTKPEELNGECIVVNPGRKHG